MPTSFGGPPLGNPQVKVTQIPKSQVVTDLTANLLSGSHTSHAVIRVDPSTLLRTPPTLVRTPPLSQHGSPDSISQELGEEPGITISSPPPSPGPQPEPQRDLRAHLNEVRAHPPSSAGSTAAGLPAAVPLIKTLDPNGAPSVQVAKSNKSTKLPAIPKMVINTINRGSKDLQRRSPLELVNSPGPVIWKVEDPTTTKSKGKRLKKSKRNKSLGQPSPNAVPTTVGSKSISPLSPFWMWIVLSFLSLSRLSLKRQKST